VLLEFRGRGKASGMDVEQLGTKGAEALLDLAVRLG
jgi:hypothetical protein